ASAGHCDESRSGADEKALDVHFLTSSQKLKNGSGYFLLKDSVPCPIPNSKKTRLHAPSPSITIRMPVSCSIAEVILYGSNDTGKMRVWRKRHKGGLLHNHLVISVKNLKLREAGVHPMVDARKFSRARREIKLNRREAVESSLRTLLFNAMREQDPTALPGAVDVIAELAATIAAQLLAETQANQRTLRTLKEDVAEFGTEFASQIVKEARKDVRYLIKKTTVAPPTAQGDAVLADDWAGPVAGPTLIERHFGIPRSTLYRWQKRGEVIWLNTRTSKKPVFPLRQFLDGKPVDGISEVSTEMGGARSAWQWLVAPHPAFDGFAPLDQLLKGRISEVIEVAREGRHG
ncbi:MAG: hypothetical protein ABIL01_26880, partial [Pseudomonadota bacterium]